MNKTQNTLDNDKVWYNRAMDDLKAGIEAIVDVILTSPAMGADARVAAGVFGSVYPKMFDAITIHVANLTESQFNHKHAESLNMELGRAMQALANIYNLTTGGDFDYNHTTVDDVVQATYDAVMSPDSDLIDIFDMGVQASTIDTKIGADYARSWRIVYSDTVFHGPTLRIALREVVKHRNALYEKAVLSNGG